MNTENKKSPWCKIYEIEDYQVLVKKEQYNDEEQKYSISVSCKTIDGHEISMSLGYSNEEEIQKIFDGCDEKMATKFVNEYVSPMEDEEE